MRDARDPISAVGRARLLVPVGQEMLRRYRGVRRPHSQGISTGKGVVGEAAVQQRRVRRLHQGPVGSSSFWDQDVARLPR